MRNDKLMQIARTNRGAEEAEFLVRAGYQRCW
jgi:hypothetical protein